MSSWHQYDPLPSACQGQLHTPQPLTSHPSELSFQSWSGTTQWQSSKFQGSTNFTKLYLSHLKIPDARSVISRKFCTEYLDISGTTTKNSVILVTWCLRFVHYCRAYPLPTAVLSSCSLWPWFTRPKFSALSANSCEQNGHTVREQMQVQQRVNFKTLQMWSIDPQDCWSIPKQQEANLHTVRIMTENPTSLCPLGTITEFNTHVLYAQYKVFKLWHCVHTVKASRPQLVEHFCRNFTASYNSKSQDLNIICCVFICTYFVFVIFMSLSVINFNATN